MWLAKRHGPRIPRARDVEKAFYIAVNRRPGDDVAIALGYRTDPSDPRVVGASWQQAGRFQCLWRQVAPAFSEFAEALGLIAGRQE
jgi:hypothetical protein